MTRPCRSEDERLEVDRLDLLLEVSDKVDEVKPVIIVGTNLGNCFNQSLLSIGKPSNLANGMSLNPRHKSSKKPPPIVGVLHGTQGVGEGK